MNIPSTPTYYTDEELALRKELQKFTKSYIFVNTNFKRTSQPIFVLAFCESRRRIKIEAKKLVFKSDTEVLKIVSEFIQEHYIETKGDIGIWGKAVNYVYHHIDNKSYCFDTEGKQIENTPVNESKAILSIKGKKL